MNKQSGLHAQEVDEGICSRCLVRVVKHKRPCGKIPSRLVLPPATPQEIIDVTDPEIIEMVKDSGMDIGDITKAQTKIIGNGELPPNYPPISMQLWTYKEALIKWHKAGRPKRTQEEVEYIHSTFCASGCEWYDEDAQRCKGCGCAVTVGSLAVLNKIKMGTEHCPKDKW
jgi:hypothetical protein